MKGLLELDKGALKTIITSLQTFALYLTIAILVALIITFIIIKYKSSTSLNGFRTFAVGVIIGYAITLISIILFVQISRMVVKEEVDITFILIASYLILTLIVFITMYILSVMKKEKLKIFSKISLSVLALLGIAFMIVKIILSYKGQAVNISGEVQLYIYTAVLIAIVSVLCFVVGKKVEVNQTKAIVYGAICIAMSFALSYIRFFELPQGGSITFVSLMPIMLYSYMFGVRRGVFIGIIYGVLQFIQAPWFYHPIQFILDYPLAFASIGLTGILKEKNILSSKKVLQFAFGAIIAVTLRYFSHVISGIFVFGSADPENYSAVAWSFLYNLFTFADLLVLLIATCPLFASKAFLNLIDTEKLK